MKGFGDATLSPQPSPRHPASFDYIEGAEKGRLPEPQIPSWRMAAIFHDDPIPTRHGG
jgi:hypothetical protein